MDAVERAVSAQLGSPVRLRRVTGAPDRGGLVGGEAAQYDALPTDARRRDWLLGRTALKALLPAGTDTSTISFPHPQFSVTHCAGIAYAAQVAGVVGTGVDFESAASRPSPATARFYLHPDEAGRDHSPEDLLRLWTVKESLFKATPDNEEVVLTGFRVHDSGAVGGGATGPREEQLTYASVVVPDGVLTVAVCRTEGVRRVAV